MTKTDDEARAVAAHLKAIYTGEALRVGEIAVHIDCPVAVPSHWVTRGGERHCGIVARRLQRAATLGLVSMTRNGRVGAWLYAPADLPPSEIQRAGDELAETVRELINQPGMSVSHWAIRAEVALAGWEDVRRDGGKP